MTDTSLPQHRTETISESRDAASEKTEAPADFYLPLPHVDRGQESLIKAASLCFFVGAMDDEDMDSLPAIHLANLMWTVRDMLEEAKQVISLRKVLP